MRVWNRVIKKSRAKRHVSSSRWERKINGCYVYFIQKWCVEMTNYKDILELDSEKDEKPLFDAIKNQTLIVFYGAGISSIAGCKSWKQLVDSIISIFPIEILSEQDKYILRNLNESEPRKVISICSQLAKRNQFEEKYFEEIKKSVTPCNDRINQFRQVHRKLFEIRAISYITTNIDRGIETIGGLDIGNKKFYNLTTEDIPKESFESLISNGNIFYLHGTISSIKNTIFSQDAYYKYYNGNFFKPFLKTIFKTKFTVLFIGYSLNEYEILQNLFDYEDRGSEKNDYRHFSIVPIFSKDIPIFELEKVYLGMHSIKAIPFIIDDIGFNKLNQVLDILVEISKRNRPSVVEIKEEIDRI